MFFLAPNVPALVCAFLGRVLRCLLHCSFRNYVDGAIARILPEGLILAHATYATPATHATPAQHRSSSEPLLATRHFRRSVDPGLSELKSVGGRK